MRLYFLAVKYWLQGDSWKEAVAYARVITEWGKRTTWLKF